MLRALETDPSAIDAGKVVWGHEAAPGYFAQDHQGAIEKGMTTYDWLHQFDPQASSEELRGLLGQMLFSGEEGLKPTARCPAAKRRGCSSAS